MSGQIAVYIVLTAIFAAGVALAWLWQIAPAAGGRRDEARLGHIGVAWYYFAAVAFFTVVCGVLAQALFWVLCRWRCPEIRMDADFGKMISMGAFGAGVAGGALYVRRLLAAMQTLQNGAQAKPAPPVALSKIPAAGAGVFCITWAAAQLVSFVWNWALDRLGAPQGGQELVELLRNEREPGRLAAMGFVAVVVAPVWEEIIFRGALFGYLRTRVPRVFAFVLPALVFAAVHYDLRAAAPLFVFGLVHCKAYERTGRIGVTIISHALFNLTTVVLVLTGVQL